MPDRSTPSDFQEIQLTDPYLLEFPPSLQPGIAELVKASALALDAGQDKWDFALELRVLRRHGLSESDLRWLMCKGIVEHARELSRKGDCRRTFRSKNTLKFKKRSCFVLADDFAQKIPDNERSVLSFRPKQNLHREVVPCWNGDRHELYLADLLVKRFRWPARNQETILASFEEDGWPVEGIDDPLPPRSEKDPKQRLRDTVKCLNRYQTNRFIRFRGDGTGERVLWELTTKASEQLGIGRSTTMPPSSHKRSG